MWVASSESGSQGQVIQRDVKYDGEPWQQVRAFCAFRALLRYWWSAHGRLQVNCKKCAQITQYKQSEVSKGKRIRCRGCSAVLIKKGQFRQ